MTKTITSSSYGAHYFSVARKTYWEFTVQACRDVFVALMTDRFGFFQYEVMLGYKDNTMLLITDTSQEDGTPRVEKYMPDLLRYVNTNTVTVDLVCRAEQISIRLLITINPNHHPRHEMEIKLL